MVKDVVSWLDYSNLAESALLLFLITFLMIVIGTLRLSKKATDRFASIPLSDDEVKDPRDGK
jgi:cytochrome c oxidase cbb3-type subunit IV